MHQQMAKQAIVYGSVHPCACVICTTSEMIYDVIGICVMTIRFRWLLISGAIFELLHEKIGYNLKTAGSTLMQFLNLGFVV